MCHPRVLAYECVICDFGVYRFLLEDLSVYQESVFDFRGHGLWLSFIWVGRKRFVMYCISCVVLLLDSLSHMLCATWKGCEAVKDVLCIFISVGVLSHCSAVMR